MFKLNEEKFLKELNSKWSNKNCPMCSHNNWQVEKSMVTTLRVSDNGGVALGGNIMPLIAVTCVNCGNVIFVNPLVLQSIYTDESKDK